MTDAKKPDVNNVIKIMKSGAVLMILLGAVVYFDLFGLSTSFGLDKDGLNKILGCLLGVIGLFEFFILPKILKAKP